MNACATIVRRTGRIGLVLLLFLTSPAAATAAQEFRATVTGRVTDEQGAVIPGVGVTVANVETNVAVETTTNESGSYTLPQLQPGTYNITAALTGFKTFVRGGVVLRTADTVTVNISLSLGSVEETVTVSGMLSETETNQSTLGQAMENKRVAELPLNGRQVYMLLQLTAGTLFTQTTFGSTGFSGTRAWDTNGSVSIHGSRTGNNEFLIDGAPNSATGGWQYAPPVDAIEEFKVQTASIDASYGRTSGGVVNMTLKSGTNAFRGSMFTFYRGNALDANSTQNNRNGVPKKAHRFVDGGGVVSGPIRRNRTFFMGGYQGFNENIPFPRTSTVPSDLQRAGDFSRTFNSAGQLIVLFDPLTTRPDPSRPGRFIRDPFPNNRIPANRMNPVALALMTFLPSANSPGEALTEANNYLASPNLGLYRYNSYLTRVDHVFSERHRAFMSNSANWGVEYRNGNGFPIPALRGNYPKHRNHYLLTLDDLVTINTTTVWNTRVGFDRFNDYNPIDYAALQGDIGIKTPFQVVKPQYPHISLAGYETFFPNSTFGQTVNNIYSVQSSVSKTLGSHFIKTGGDFRAYRLDRISLGEGMGRFDFTRGFTQRDPQSGDATSGNAFASFLLGYPSGGGVDVAATSARQYLYYALFVQDDWKLSSRLTLSLGLRWDYQAPVTVRDNRLTIGFDQRTPNPLQVPGLSLSGGLLFADDDNRSPYRSDWDNIQPRVSLSYKLLNRLILRSNYGRSFLPLSGSGEEGINQTGFSRRTSFISSIQTGIPFNTLDRPFPEGILQPANGAEGLATNIGSGFSFLNPSFKIPYVDQWMLGFDMDLPWSVGLDIAYVGNRTRELPINGRAINEVSRQERERAIEAFGGNASYLSTQLTNPFTGRVPGTSLNQPTASRGQLLRPFPQFTGITMDRVNEAWASYDALELTANKRVSHGLMAVVNYTLMRMNEAVSYLNNGFDARPVKDIATIDRTHRIALTALYDLPLGPGRRFGAGTHGLVAHLISGWQFNVIGEIQSRTPTAMPNGILLQDSVKLAKDQQSLDRWFDNSTRFNPRPDGTYAWDTLPPNAFRVLSFRLRDVRDPWEPQWAFSFFKNMRFADRVTAQLRVEMFNALNTPIYGGPDTGITSARFGRITANQINFPRHTQIGLRVLF